MTDVVVAGGGLAGLVAARQLAAAGNEVTLFERDASVGGRIRTDHHEGYTLDRGFQVVIDSYPAVQRELDLAALELRRFAPGATLARSGERSVLADPFRDPGALTGTLFNREVSFADKLRTLRLRLALGRTTEKAILDPSGPDRTIDAYLAEYGFSPAFVERFVAPFYGGITLDRSLSTDARVFEYTFKSLTGGHAAVPAGGMASIPEQLRERARAAGVGIETDATVQAVDTDGTVRVDGETVAADGVVVATDPATAQNLTDVSTPDGKRGCATVYARLPTHTPLDTGKRLLLNVEHDRPNHVAQLSAVAPEYAPDGEQLLAATFLGVPDADDEALFRQTRETLASWYPERSVSGLEHVRTERVPFAQFDQPPGFRANLPAPTAPAGPVVLAGDYTRWCSIQGALESGRVAATALRETTGGD